MIRWILLALALFAPPVRGEHSYDPAALGRAGVVVIANRRVPEGVELARQYAAYRGVPEEQVLLLDLPDTETMSRADYEQRLRDPLLAALRDRKLVEQVRRETNKAVPHESGWITQSARLRYLVLFYGVPLRIDDTKPWPLEKVANLVNQGAQRDAAAVDSELMLLLQESYELRGRIANPQYNQLVWEKPAAGPPHLLVGRLDGPDPLLVRRMMEDAWHAESNGLLGRIYIDTRARHGDDYQIGDYWLEEAGNRFQREGYEVVFERTDAVFGDAYPMDDAAVYLGWYADQVTGPFARTNFHFRPGAIAYHNHSGNARTLRSATDYWAGPLLARGAAVTMGAVAEPFLYYTPHLSIVADRICLGAPWVDAVSLSLSALSWQNTIVGDPLYRPFLWPVDEQIARLAKAHDPALDWAYLRKINLLVREGRLNVALRYARDRLQQRADSWLIPERIADLYVLNELYDEAIPMYERALSHAPRVETSVRIATRFMTLLESIGKREQAQKIAESVRDRWPHDPLLRGLPGTGP